MLHASQKAINLIFYYIIPLNTCGLDVDKSWNFTLILNEIHQKAMNYTHSIHDLNGWLRLMIYHLWNWFDFKRNEFQNWIEIIVICLLPASSWPRRLSNQSIEEKTWFQYQQKCWTIHKWLHGMVKSKVPSENEWTSQTTLCKIELLFMIIAKVYEIKS